MTWGTTEHGDPLVVAHRGRAHGAAVENDLAGVVAALDAGCHGVEVDVRRALDGPLVLLHDPTPRRTTTGDARVRLRAVEHSTSTDLARLRLRGTASARVPLLDEVLDACLSRGARVVVDVKGARLEPRVWDSLHATLARRTSSERELVVVQATDPLGLAALRTRLPEVRTSRLGWRRSPAVPVPLDADVASQPWWSLTRERIAQEHALGHTVLAWTVNEPGRMEALLERGVDGVITDEPALLVRELHRHPTAA